ncbi:unnamed protein product [Brachionus calyciflorus]|uniref:Tyrosine-protein kinase n=1 Tax=Brachionus calyciflorus TaxID=104777 RepID=A0A813M1Y7_9BILA|nr:unnamed protein product [Brachionus calyciflorus]
MGKSISKDLPKNTFVAVFDYDKKSRDELSFTKDDYIVKIYDIDHTFMFAKNTRTQRNGIVNCDMVLPIDSYELQPWYFGKYCRAAAEIQLLSTLSDSGCFLIRESEITDKNYTLSILYNEQSSRFVKHYKINYSKKRFFLSPKHKFRNLNDLVTFYSKNKKDGRFYLTKPCEKIIKRPVDNFDLTLNDVLVDDSRINPKFCEPFKGYLKNETEVLLKLTKYCTSKRLLNEIEFLKKLDNRNVIKLIGASVTFPFVFGCLENMPFNDLETHIKTNKINKFIIVKIAKQICSAMIYLLDNFIIHRNIRARNILIGNNYFVKLANFCFAQHLDLNRQHIVDAPPKEISPRWSAYEIIKCCEVTGYRIYSEKSEVWSFGIMLYELFSRQEPYEGISDAELVNKICDENYRMADPQQYFEEKTSVFYENIIVKCWPKCYVMRPTFKDLRETFFNYFDQMEPDYIFPHDSNLKSSNKETSYEETSDTINLGVLLESGNFSEIWKASYGIDNEIVIVKKFKKITLNQKYFDLNMNKFLHESKILKQLRHPNIIKLISVSSFYEHYIVLEFMRNGSLDKFLLSKDGKMLNFPQIVNFAEQISNGMMFLDCNRIIHGDLAARNILVGKFDKITGRYPIKIADFELSHVLNGQNQIKIPIKKKIEFATRWSAPEVVIGIDNFRIFSTKSDVYSFGIVLFELITKGELPFKEIDQEDLEEKVFRENYIIQRQDLSCPEEYYNIMRNCLNFDADKRPYFSTLYEWFFSYFQYPNLRRKNQKIEQKKKASVECMSNIKDNYGLLIEVDRL